MLKTDERFLYGLLTLSQEQNIKTGRFSMIYADEVVISHTNEHEYTAFVGNKKSEALQDRIIVVKVPYNLRVTRRGQDLREAAQAERASRRPHRSRHAGDRHHLRRPLPPRSRARRPGMSLIKKLKLYDGQTVEGFTPKDVTELQDEALARAWTASRHATSSTASRTRSCTTASPASTRSTRSARCATVWSSTPASTAMSTSGC